MFNLDTPHITHGVRSLRIMCAGLLIGASFFAFSQNLAQAVPSNPTNTAIQATQNEVDAAREKQDNLATDLELASEDYEEAKANLDAVRATIRQTDVQLKDAQAELVAIQEQFENRAVNIYKNDTISFVDVLMGASDFSDLVTRVQFMTQISQQDAEIMQSIRQAKAKIENAKLKLEEQEKEQSRLTTDASAKQRRAQRIYAEQNAYLNSLNDQLKEQVAQERARLEEVARKEAAAAAERARVAAEAARREAAAEAARKAASSSNNNGSSNQGSGSQDSSSNSDNLGAANSRVVSIARQFIGKTPYVWGGSTPSGFDCSGLTQYCYRQIGKSIPRNSRAQYQAGVSAGVMIPASRTDLLEPGDLLFFARNKDASRIHHVAIYAGNGRMIHAPQTGQMVSETSLWARSDYVGATRP